MRREIATEIDIAAPASHVWNILSDFSLYPDWNPFIFKIKGAPRVGTWIRFWFELPRGLRLPACATRSARRAAGAGLLHCAIAVFIIEKKFVEAAAFSAAGAALTFFGFMHGESVGIAVTPSVAFAYAVVAAFLFALSRMPAEAAEPEMTVPKAVPAE